MSRKERHVVAIIHARGGSRRIPLKNVADVGGRPLINWMIEAARGSQRVDRVIVSTDHDDIAQVSREAGAEVPFRRPAELSTDCPSEWVSQHAVRFLENEGYAVSIPITLQPTTPFCAPTDIDACVDLLVETGADTVMTFRSVHERPEWMYSLEGGKATKFIPGTYGGDTGISQKLPPMFIPNGAVYATSYECLMDKGLIIGDDVYGVIVPDERSLDIDEPIDLLVANALAAQMKKPPPE